LNVLTFSTMNVYSGI